MDNYAVMQERARMRFLTYSVDVFNKKKGIAVFDDRIFARFLGENAEISLKTGEIIISGKSANFGEALCLYDWLCDGRQNACASGEFASVSSLPGVMVRGNGLTIDTILPAQKAMENTEAFESACRSIGGKRRQTGDISYEIPLFSDLTALVKFYYADDEFPPGLTLLCGIKIFCNIFAMKRCITWRTACCIVCKYLPREGRHQLVYPAVRLHIN